MVWPSCFSADEISELQSARPLLLVSGGADSVFLFRVFLHLKEHSGISFAVLHVNHGLRGEAADADARFVRELAEKNGIPCFIERLSFTGKGNLQEEARLARYKICLEYLHKNTATHFFTAHHRDDFLETIVMRNSRGAGWRGLAGMRRRTIFKTPGSTEILQIMRPLCGIPKNAIVLGLKNAGQPWREDASNRTDKYWRNRVRFWLEREYPEWKDTPEARNALEAAAKLGLISDYFDARVKTEIGRHGRRVSLTVWETWPDELRFRYFVCQMHLKGAKEQVERLHFAKLTGSDVHFHLGDAHVFKDRSGVRFYSASELHQLGQGIVIERPGAYFFGIFGKSFLIQKDQFLFPLILAPAGRYGRAPLKSSFIKIRGRKVALKDFFSENAYGKFERLFTPVLWDAQGRVIKVSEKIV